jgi:GntR family transcriptional regulator
MPLDLGSKLPLYYQLKEEIKVKILSGILKEGDMISSERELSEKYNLSSTTVRRALNDLVHENLLERKAGKGSFVRLRRVQRDLRKVLSFTNNMREMGLVPSSRVLGKKMVPAKAFVQESLGLPKGTSVFRLDRLRLATEIPMMLETRYIRDDLCPGIMERDLSTSLWRVFEDVYGHKPHRHSQTLRIVTISGKFAQLLGMENNSPVYLIKGITYLGDGQAIECEESLYRGDKYEVTFEAVVG